MSGFGAEQLFGVELRSEADCEYPLDDYKQCLTAKSWFSIMKSGPKLTILFIKTISKKIYYKGVPIWDLQKILCGEQRPVPIR